MTAQQIKREIGKRLKRARKDKGYTQEDVAGLLGLKQVSYSAFERGRSLISLEHLLKLPRILDKPITYFLPDSVVSEAEKQRLMLDPRFNEIAGIWLGLGEEGKDLVYRLAVAMGEKEISRQQKDDNEISGRAVSLGGDI